MSRDLRRYARQTNFRLAGGGVILLFLVGIGLVYLFYGLEAAIMGLVCMILGLAPLLLIWLSLWLLELVVKWANR